MVAARNEVMAPIATRNGLREANLSYLRRFPAILRIAARRLAGARAARRLMSTVIGLRRGPSSLASAPAEYGPSTFIAQREQRGGVGHDLLRARRKGDSR